VRNTGFKVGVNLLRNSGREAYAIAVTTKARFIRVNTLVDTILSDSGIIEPEAPRLKPIVHNYPGIEIYADILVKHATSPRPVLGFIESSSMILSRGAPEEYLRDLIDDYVERGRASTLVVTGLRTGEPLPFHLVRLVKRYSSIPVLVGSGVSAENIKTILREVDGVIVGSFVKRDGKAGNQVDPERARSLIQRAMSESRIKI
ncbi:MAG: BtpA/SgcQ family protein, partial [Desulfurococcaceae archaeon]